MFKTIVVYIDGSAGQASRLLASAMLANDHGAHLVGCAATGLSWAELSLLTGSMATPLPVADFDALRDGAQERLRGFADEARRVGVASCESRLMEAAADDGLLLQSRYCDLVVLSQDTDRPLDAGFPANQRRLPERLALQGARPVLVVPDSYGGQSIPGTVIAGWDGSTQALRALTAALPLLRRADKLRLVLVNPEAPALQHGEEPGADIALWLARHSVPVEVVIERTRATAGNVLAALARDSGAGLMVSGAYGHSRYREWVLGGATRELLARAPVPLLTAH